MKLKIILLIVLFAIQLAIPGYMIFEQNQILTEGTAYKFKTRPIDPYDPFRGRYVTLAFEANQEVIPVVDGADIESEQWYMHCWVLMKRAMQCLEDLPIQSLIQDRITFIWKLITVVTMVDIT